MLSLFTPQGRVFLKSTILGNPSAQRFLFPKILFILLASITSFEGTVWLAGLIWLAVEIGLSIWSLRHDLRLGFTRKRSRNVAGTRLLLVAIFGVVAWPAFTYLWLVLALPLATALLLGLLMAFLGLSLWRVFKDLQGVPPTENSGLFQQVREMHELDTVHTQLQTRLITTHSYDDRRDLVFYLGWADTYRGHRLLELGLWAQAASYYKTALKTDPANMAARVSLAICYLRQDEFELALGEIRQGVSIFNGNSGFLNRHQKYDEALWNWHRNEVSSEYEQSAALFQLCALAIALLQTSTQSGATKQLLSQEYCDQALQIPGRTKEELNRLMSRKVGGGLSALQVLMAGPFRAPAAPLEMLYQAVVMPMVRVQTVEDAESAA